MYLSKKRILLCLLPVLLSGLFACSSFDSAKLSDGSTVYAKDSENIGAEAVLSGKVIDRKTKKPVANASVEIKNANLGVGYYKTTTNSSGWFTIRDFIPYIQYNIEVNADGYVRYFSSSNLSGGTHNISLIPEAAITGKVTDSSGMSITGVDIKIDSGSYGGNPEGMDKPQLMTTGESGIYRFDKLPQGGYTLSFSAPGYISETMFVKRVKEGEDFKLPVVMYRPSSISGTINISDLNVAARNVTVVANGRQNHSTATFQDGTYKIEDMKPGTYEIVIQHQGFHTPAKRSITLRESETSSGVDYSLRIKSPEVQVYSHRYTFAPGNELSFNLRTFRLESVNVTVYAAPINVFLKGANNPDVVDPQKSNFKVFTQWEEPIRDFDPYQWRYQEITIKDPLPTGGYCIEIKGAGNIINRKYFTVTSTGVVVKRSEKKVFAYVTNLITNEPVKNASVAVFENPPKRSEHNGSEDDWYYTEPESVDELPVKILSKGITNENGIYEGAVASNHHVALIAVSPDSSYAICNTGSPSMFQREQDKFMIYTDRPVYRSGDKVFYKIIGKTRDERFTPQRNRRIFYKIINRYNNKIVREAWVNLDEWGTAHDSVTIDESAGLGQFAIQAGPEEDNTYDSGTFYVEQYRKPEYKVEVSPSKDYFINGDELEFKVEGKYFFGAPVKGGMVNFHFYEKKLEDSASSYWWEEGQDNSASYNRLRLEGSKYLDENGVASLKLAAGNYPYDREITLEVSVIDQSNVSITERTTVRVGRGEFYIKIKPAESFFRTDGKKTVAIQTLKQTGEPIKANVKIDVYRYIWKPYQRIYVHEAKPRYSEKVTTDAKGNAVISLPAKFADPGEYDIVATAQDRRDNRINASYLVWVYSPSGGEISSRFRNLELTVNKNEFQGDGEVTCLLKSRYSDGYVCLTVEGRDIYQSKVVKLQGNITPVTLKVNSAYAPNFYISGVMQRKRALYTDTQPISIPVKGTRLNISMKPDKEKYRPGETASIAINAVDENGKPVLADISLGAVDEAIYSVRRDNTPKMSDFFYAKISNWVLTSYSYPITLLAGAGKSDQSDVRQDFKDTAFWKADIRTDAAGKARVSFKLPDNLTTWRLTARGHDRDGKVGEKKENFLVTQDLVARIAKPRFLIEGDSVSLLGIINSNTQRGLTSVKTDMKMDDKPVKPDKDSPVSLPAFASESKSYTINVPKGESAVLRFDANADAQAKDALKLTVPIERRGSAFKLYGNGDMAANSSITLSPVQGGDDFEFVPESVSITVNPTPLIQMLKASEYLVNYPYGCIEQTLAGFMPSFALHSFLKKNNMLYLVSQDDIQKIENKTSSGLRRIENAQNDDGSWGWWAGGEGNAYLTAYVMESLHRASGLGRNINSGVVTRGINSMISMLNSSNIKDNDAKAYLLYACALYGKFQRSAFDKLNDIKSPSVYASAYILRALYVGRPVFDRDKTKNSEIFEKHASRFMNIVKGAQQRDGKGIYWLSAGNTSAWTGARAEMTANVLAALTAASDTSPIAAQAAVSIGKRTRGSTWSSTKESSYVIYSLIDHMNKTGTSAGAPLDLMFTIDGKEIGRIKYNPADKVLASELTKTLKLGKSEGLKSVNISAAGSAGGDVGFEAVVSGTLYFKPSGIFSIFKSEGRSLTALSNGISVYREYASLTRVMDGQRREYLVPVSLKDSETINVGDEILVKLRFKAQDNFEFLVLEDYLPSGFEVVKENAYQGESRLARAERWDNRMVYFFNNLTKGQTYEVAYILRAELAGKFMARPARMECMYEPSIQGWSAPVIIDVKKK